jgi:hypothetical protein
MNSVKTPYEILTRTLNQVAYSDHCAIVGVLLVFES